MGWLAVLYQCVFQFKSLILQQYKHNICLYFVFLQEGWLVIKSDVISSPKKVAFVPEWPGSSILSVGLKEATVTAISRMMGGGRELGEAKM